MTSFSEPLVLVSDNNTGKLLYVICGVCTSSVLCWKGVENDYDKAECTIYGGNGEAEDVKVDEISFSYLSGLTLLELWNCYF